MSFQNPHRNTMVRSMTKMATAAAAPSALRVAIRMEEEFRHLMLRLACARLPTQTDRLLTRSQRRTRPRPAPLRARSESKRLDELSLTFAYEEHVADHIRVLRANCSRRAPPSASKQNNGRGMGGSSAGILRFYTDDSPGMKIGPTTVLVSCLLYVGFVVLLHVWGKLRG